MEVGSRIHRAGPSSDVVKSSTTVYRCRNGRGIVVDYVCISIGLGVSDAFFWGEMVIVLPSNLVT